MFMKSGNPVLQDRAWESARELSGRGHMTVEGTANKVILFLSIVIVFGAVGWNLVPQGAIGGSIGIVGAAMVGALGLGLVIGFVPRLAKPLGWLYAVMQGLLLGGFSALLNARYPGIALQAAGLTATVSIGMFFVYRTGVTRRYPMFWKVVSAMTLGIGLLYLVQAVAVFGFGWSFPFIHDTGPMGIGFSLFVCALASLNLCLDYHFIEQGEKLQLPKDTEWYAAFGLTVTLCWLYFEILRLLAKLRE